MSAAPNEKGETIGAFLAGYARTRTDRRLVIDAGLGLVIGAVVAVFRPPGWPPVLGLSTAIGAFGLWGIFDRELSERATRSPEQSTRGLRAGRIAAALLGGLGGALLILSVFALALGTWIS